LAAIDRYKDLATYIPISDDQRVNVVRCQLDLGPLTCARFLFEILPTFPDTLNLIVRSVEFRHGHRRFRDRMRFRQPINTVHYCRVPLKTPIHAGKTSDRQYDPEHQKNKTASREAAQSLPSRRRLDPGVHGTGLLVSDLLQANPWACHEPDLPITVHRSPITIRVRHLRLRLHQFVVKRA